MLPSLPDFPVEGGCTCSALRYRLSAAPLGVYNCHCKDCQRLSGGSFSSSMIARRQDFTLLSGELHTYDKLADSGRIVRQQSCAICGTRIFHQSTSSPDFIVMRPGTLDDSDWTLPIGDIWTDSRAPWTVIDWSRPTFPGQPASREPLFAAWRAQFDAAA